MGEGDESQGSVGLKDQEISYHPSSGVQIPLASGAPSKPVKEILLEQTQHSGLPGPIKRGCDFLGPLAVSSLPYIESLTQRSLAWGPDFPPSPPQRAPRSPDPLRWRLRVVLISSAKENTELKPRLETQPKATTHREAESKRKKKFTWILEGIEE